MRLKILVAASVSATLVSCGQSPTGRTQRSAGEHSPEVIETAWTQAALNRAELLMLQHKLRYALPEVRIYDASQRLIFRQIGDKPEILGPTLDRTIASDRTIAGPSFAETVGDLETADHHPAAERLPANGEITVVDYWASWCVPCKGVEKKLKAWAATKPDGVVRIVKAEADLITPLQAEGIKVEHDNR